MDHLFELPVEDMGMNQCTSSPSTAPALSHQVSMNSYLPHDSVISLQLADLQDMDMVGGDNSNSPNHHESANASREMVANNGGGLWSAYNKRPSVAEQGSFSEQQQYQQYQHQEQQRALIARRGSGHQPGQSSFNGHPTCPVTPVATNERPVKRQRVISQYRR